MPWKPFYGNNQVQRFRTGLPKCATLACELFWTEDNQDPAGSWETFTSPLKI